MIDAESYDLPPVATRFCRYVRIDTTSDPDSDTVPTTERQKDLARLLVEELQALGATNVAMDSYGYVFASLPTPLPPAEADALPILGLCAHMDTSPDAPGAHVRPYIHPDYDGGSIPFAGAPELTLTPTASPALNDVVGQDLITSDGTTLLGSDDKAGVAILVQLAADLLRVEREASLRGERPPARPHVRLLFTPDEEVGRGTDHLDIARWGAEIAYTLDGSGTDRLNVETFNAAEAVVTIQGVGVHPGYAKGVMVNAARVASLFVAALPSEQAPETTEGREGYFHPHHVTGDVNGAEVRILLRDFTSDGMEKKRALVYGLAEDMQRQHPGATLRVEINESYRNMLSYIEETDPRVVSVAQEAAGEMGFEIALEPIRGGTDGARLSERGIPTPNVFTGGHEFHSVFEWNTVQNLERALDYTLALVRAWARVT